MRKIQLFVTGDSLAPHQLQITQHISTGGTKVSNTFGRYDVDNQTSGSTWFESCCTHQLF